MASREERRRNEWVLMEKTYIFIIIISIHHHRLRFGGTEEQLIRKCHKNLSKFERLSLSLTNSHAQNDYREWIKLFNEITMRSNIERLLLTEGKKRSEGGWQQKNTHKNSLELSSTLFQWFMSAIYSVIKMMNCLYY